jgi:hypothetical protein
MLAYDQIPPDRRTVLDYSGRIENHNGVLGVALAQWAARSADKPDAAARRAANTAMGSVDAMLAELHELRARLVSEIRESDDQTAIRVDELLARCKEEPR